MTSAQRHGSLFTHLRKICERPRMYAPRFTLEHLELYIFGYESALSDAGLPSQHERFRSWLYRERPEWRNTSLWWGGHVLAEHEGDLERTLEAIISLLDRFLATDGT